MSRLISKYKGEANIQKNKQQQQKQQRVAAAATAAAAVQYKLKLCAQNE